MTIALRRGVEELHRNGAWQLVLLTVGRNVARRDDCAVIRFDRTDRVFPEPEWLRAGSHG
jgi:hypothetical protein